MEISDSRCGVCGGHMVRVRGRYPGNDKREVCPVCLADRLDQIREISDKEYGRQYSAVATWIGCRVEGKQKEGG